MRISIVIPNKNTGEFLEAAIVSVLEQDYQNREIILIDGCSTDNSHEIIDRYRPYLDVVEIAADNGQAQGLNRGFRRATGDVMCWLNSDDLFMHGALRSVAEVFSSFDHVQWITGNLTTIAEDGRMNSSAHPRVHSRIRWLCGDWRWLEQESTFWRRSLWEKSGARIDETYKLAVDAELWFRFFEHAPLHSVKVGLGAFRFRRGQRSHEHEAAYYQEVDRAIVEARDRVSGEFAVRFRDALAQGAKTRTREEAEKLPSIMADDMLPLHLNPRTLRFIDPNLKGLESTPILPVAPAFVADAAKPAAEPASPPPAPVEDVYARIPPHLFLHSGAMRPADDLTPLRNRHAGQRCVIMGNGPSLNKMDLDVFAGEHVFAANSIFLLFDRIRWRPSYYACVDTRVLPDIAADIVRMRDENPDMSLFFPSELMVHDGTERVLDTRGFVPPRQGTYFFRQRPMDLSEFPDTTFSLDLANYVCTPMTVTITLMQLAVYMGFVELYLIGCDTSYVIPKTVQQSGPEANGGKLFLTSTADDDPNHFDQRYFGAGRAWHNPKTQDMIWHYRQAALLLEEYGVRVYNATVGGALEVFQRVDYADVFTSGNVRRRA